MRRGVVVGSGIGLFLGASLTAAMPLLPKLLPSSTTTWAIPALGAITGGIIAILKPRLDAYSAELNQRIANDLQRSEQAEEALAWAAGSREKLPVIEDVKNLALLGVHPAIPADEQGSSVGSGQPKYIERDIDQAIIRSLRDAKSSGGLVLIVGPAASGKTRTAYETLLAEIPGWKILAPSTGSDLTQAVESDAIPSETVVWLDDIDRYLESSPLVARAIRRAILDPDRAIIFQGTIWPEKYNELSSESTSSPVPSSFIEAPGEYPSPLHVGNFAQAVPDRGASGQIRDILRLAHIHDLPQQCSDAELARAVIVSHEDARVAEALRQSPCRDITRTLAAAPLLLRKLANPDNLLGRSVLSAAVHVRRAGHPKVIPELLLASLAEALYLTPAERADADGDWLGLAIRWASTPVCGAVAALKPYARRVGVVEGFEVSDILVEWSRKCGPQTDPYPEGFWQLLIDGAQPESCVNIGVQACKAEFPELAVAAWMKAADANEPAAMYNLANQAQQGGDEDGFLRWHGRACSLGYMESAADLGYHFAEAGKPELARGWYEQAAQAGNTRAIYNLGLLLSESGDKNGAAACYAKGVDAGDVGSMVNLAFIYHEDERVDESLELWERAAQAGSKTAMANLGLSEKDRGNISASRAWYLKAADLGAVSAMIGLGNLEMECRNHVAAISWYKKAIIAGEHRAHNNLGLLYERRGMVAEAELCLSAGAEANDERAMANLGHFYYRRGEIERSRLWLEKSQERGSPLGQLFLAVVLMEQGETATPVSWLDKALRESDETTVAGMVLALGTTGRVDVVFERFERMFPLRRGTRRKKRDAQAFFLMSFLAFHPVGAVLLTEWVKTAERRESSIPAILGACFMLGSLGNPEALRHCAKRAAAESDRDWVIVFSLQLIQLEYDKVLDGVANWCLTHDLVEAANWIVEVQSKERDPDKAR
ncbi:hypothetical protein ACQPYV_14785 [Micromonospora saelicesensis]|uniref:hypothetical protein n=1 Tax=Micromonospora saelicesensis TaxID=285676 RepID=UPI003D925EF9